MPTPPVDWNADGNRRTAPRPSRTPLWNGSGVGRTPASGRDACGGCCTRPRPGPKRSLSRNVEDVDLDNKRIRVTSKGGDTEWLHFQSGAARLLPKIIGGRPSGPLFLADRRPSPARVPAAGDICPHTGRGRLSYQRAAYLFKTHSQKVTKTSATLHQLRHSALTHLAEANVGLPLLMAKSRHTSLRSLQRYARPGADAVAAMTATHDPAARRRGSDPR